MKSRWNPHRVTAAWLVAAAILLMAIVGVVEFAQRRSTEPRPPATNGGQGAAARQAEGEDASDPPALEMLGVEVVGRSGGETQWRLQGARVSQEDADGGVVTFEDVQRATLYRTDGSTFQLEADSAVWDTSQNDLELWGDVRLAWREAAAGERAGVPEPVSGGEATTGASESSEPHMWTEGLRRLRIQAEANRVQFIGPFQLVWRVGDENGE